MARWQAPESLMISARIVPSANRWAEDLKMPMKRIPRRVSTHMTGVGVCPGPPTIAILHVSARTSIAAWPDVPGDRRPSQL